MYCTNVSEPWWAKGVPRMWGSDSCKNNQKMSLFPHCRQPLLHINAKCDELLRSHCYGWCHLEVTRGVVGAIWDAKRLCLVLLICWEMLRWIPPFTLNLVSSINLTWSTTWKKLVALWILSRVLLALQQVPWQEWCWRRLSNVKQGHFWVNSHFVHGWGVTKASTRQ